MIFEIYTDGACSGNRLNSECKGGYGYIIILNYRKIMKGGGFRINVTNNQMELIAVIGSLLRLKKFLRSSQSLIKDHDCIINSDSQYVTENWNDYIIEWANNGWRKSNGKALLNKKLWKKIYSLVLEFKTVKFKWVEGHGDDKNNQEVDHIAKDFIKRSPHE
jgi:ribonuclease HI